MILNFQSLKRALVMATNSICRFGRTISRFNVPWFEVVLQTRFKILYIFSIFHIPVIHAIYDFIYSIMRSLIISMTCFDKFKEGKYS